MRNEVLESQVQLHICEQLPVCLAAWRRCLELMSGPGGRGEFPLVHLATLAQRTRTLTRLLGEEHAETAAVALETLLTMLLKGELLYAGEIRKNTLKSAEAMLGVLAAHVRQDGAPESGLKTPDELRRPLVETVHKFLRLIRANTVANAYGGPCVAFPVQHVGEDSAPLRLRGFDLYRIEMEDLRLFLLEMPWESVAERPNGLPGLLEYISRNGHAFDARPAWSLAAQPEKEAVLRLLCGFTLAPDFLEVLLQIPAQRIHQVNPLMVRRYKPSWNVAGPSAATHTEKSPYAQSADGVSKTVEELTVEYTTALNRMFATSRNAPRDEHLPEHLF